VDVRSLAPRVPTHADTGLPQVGLAISVNGDYFSVLDYLDRLDHLSRIVVIDQLSLTPGDAGPAKGPQLAVSITGRMFSTTAPQIAPVTTTTVPAAGGSTTTTAPTSTAVAP
jgi:Tfp pilus assembly protein PilO